MLTLKRTLALIVVAAVSGCGGGSGSQVPVTPAAVPSSAAIARTPNATATITLQFPTHTVKAKAGRTKSGTTRKPAYINPSGGSLVFAYQGTAIDDPNNNNQPYFSLGTQDPSTGTSTLVVPLVSGTYNAGDLTVTEYDQSNGTGNVLAYGYNGAYTDSSGNHYNGSFTVASGGTVYPVITMAMNVAYIAVTTDPLYGSDAETLSSTYNNYTQLCESNGTTLYFFPADADSTIVLPSTQAGYTGGDVDNYAPGVPSVTMYSQYSGYGVNGPPIPTLVQSVLGGSAFTLRASYSYDTVNATLEAANSLNTIYGEPFYSSSTVYGYLTVGPGAATCQPL